MIINLWAHRHLVFQRAWEELRVRYTGSAMGIFWNVLNPLAQILIYTAVFSLIIPMALPGKMSRPAGFALYLCSGFLPWMAFLECVTRGTNSFLENATYLKKLPIPEQVFVAQNALSATFSLCISMILLLIICLVLSHPFTWTWLLLIPILLLFQGLAFGLGLTLGCVNVFFRDVNQIVIVGLQMWMWLTPIVYVIDILNPTLQTIWKCNPVFPYIDAAHKALLFNEVPPLWEWLTMVGWCLGSWIIGYFVLRKLRPEIRDQL